MDQTNFTITVWLFSFVGQRDNSYFSGNLANIQHLETSFRLILQTKLWDGKYNIQSTQCTIDDVSINGNILNICKGNLVYFTQILFWFYFCWMQKKIFWTFSVHKMKTQHRTLLYEHHLIHFWKILQFFKRFFFLFIFLGSTKTFMSWRFGTTCGWVNVFILGNLSF